MGNAGPPRPLPPPHRRADLLDRRTAPPHCARPSLLGRAKRPVESGLELGRQDLNSVRERLGLGPLTHVHGGTSRRLALVGTFPQLEYPRARGWGPMFTWSAR